MDYKLVDGFKHSPDCPEMLPDRFAKNGKKLVAQCGDTFVCETCYERVGLCVGASDDHPEDCDECANRKDSQPGASP